MGGTSSDVSLVRDGRAERTTDAEIDGLPIPDADGRREHRRRGRRLRRLGRPGGRSGSVRVRRRRSRPRLLRSWGTEPTVTDAAVVLGYIGPDTALGGELTLDVDAARDALEGDWRTRPASRTGSRPLAGLPRGERDDDANDPGPSPSSAGTTPSSRSWPSAARGRCTPRRWRTRCPSIRSSSRDRAVLSAFGLPRGRRELRRGPDRRRGSPGGRSGRSRGRLRRPRGGRPRGRVRSGRGAARARAADCRYAGQSFELTVPVDDEFDAAGVAERFHDAHERAHGYAMDESIDRDRHPPRDGDSSRLGADRPVRRRGRRYHRHPASALRRRCAVSNRLRSGSARARRDGVRAGDPGAGREYDRRPARVGRQRAR